MAKILIISENACSTEGIELVLIPAGFEVCSINASPDQLQSACQWHPDVVILDVLQPSNNGWQDYHRAIHKHCRAPILVLSIANDPHVVAQALDGGADDYLSKPISAEVLIAHLNNLTRRARVGQLAP